MAEYHVKRPIMVDGKRFGIDRIVDLDPDQAGPLEDIGAVVRAAPVQTPAPPEGDAALEPAPEVQAEDEPAPEAQPEEAAPEAPKPRRRARK